MTTEPPQLDEAPEEIIPAELNWAAEIIGKSPQGHVIKIQVTFSEEPNHDREQKMRAQVQSLMRQYNQEWCRTPGSIVYRKWPLK